MKRISHLDTRYLPHVLKTRINTENDNERFYSFLSFYSLEDLWEQGKRHLKRSNNIPMQVLKYKTLIEMRQELLKQ